ncbi:hypothetical protein OWM54_06320 [Myxococcus sp. MISCRS1]|uniref:hypothetical protein n=1 Tax=Myxococcus TaxID=32 RepID=UPI001CBDCD67|nr:MULTISPECIES: hypothetical protein [unclassified Myxococcus]MBZ4397135.1 hypothetical protein [Myxococcus sp. AS-1-15]MBZ4408141.1 hypothetical protein [Myxococcus sp. XM-1-1-1]MCY0996751.1 hypothetical protein [Myxococcus sp. MISCRS1]BDT33237.1 hypothetical protein MFMH1_29060 [Myxococcus sp. MH1]
MRGMASCLLGLMMLLGSPSWAEPRGEVDRAQEELLPLAVVTCPVGAFRTTFTPPLRETPQDVRIQGEGGFSNCYTLLGERVTSSVSATDFVRPNYDCFDLLEILPVTIQLTWNTGEVSTFRLTQVTARADGPLLVLVQTGTVLSGKFEGATVVMNVTFTSTDLDACRSPEGLRGMSATQTLVMTRVL